MKFEQLINKTLTSIKQNTPLLLSSTAVAGVVTTSYLTAKASFRAAEEITHHESTTGVEVGWKNRLKSRAPYCWKFYIPATASGVVTIACIVGTTRVGNKRAMAAQAAFVVSERAYNEYRDKVIEEIGSGKEQKIRDKIAEDKIKNNPPSNLLVVGAGNVLCCELYTGRYFSSDMETLRKAQNDINAQLIRDDAVSLAEWYYKIGLPETSYCGDTGWNSDKMMELEFSTVLTEEGRPCLAFEYNYTKPLYEGLFK